MPTGYRNLTKKNTKQRVLNPNLQNAREYLAHKGRIAIYVQLYREEAAHYLDWCEMQGIERVDLGIRMLAAQHFGPLPDVSMALALRHDWEARLREVMIAALKEKVVEVFQDMKIEEEQIPAQISRLKGEIA